ncbi:metallophosphoesterase family protein [soil metagenome]
MDDAILKHVDKADEVWHAGDIGVIATSDQISRRKPLRAVYGNVDDHKVRITFPEINSFVCEGVKVWMTHIGGYPGHYKPGLKQKLIQERPHLFICGHSHILKVMKDPILNLLHMNPGAAGVHGFHVVRTMLSFKIHEGKILELDVIELGLRGKLPETVG